MEHGRMGNIPGTEGDGPTEGESGAFTAFRPGIPADPSDPTAHGLARRIGLNTGVCLSDGLTALKTCWP